ncbi:MAG: hypothetical protein IT556_01580 [Acetobacteraceae bacterium]|nr:hypothetical protein [Acetobacteraceae bacterium]
MIGFRLTVLELQRIVILHAALPPDEDELAELEAFLPALARRGYARAVLDLTLSPPMDPREAWALGQTARRLAGQNIRLALVAAPEAEGATAAVGLAVHNSLSEALRRSD